MPALDLNQSDSDLAVAESASPYGYRRGNKSQNLIQVTKSIWKYSTGYRRQYYSGGYGGNSGYGCGYCGK